MAFPRKRQSLDPLSPHAIRIAIVKRLVAPASLTAKGGYARELHILKRLQAICPDDAFFLDLRPAEKLNSLAWFLTEYGRTALQQQFDLHRFGKAQEQFQLDSAASRPMIESSASDIADLPPLRPKGDDLMWADDTSI